MFTADQFVAHLVGDYILQSHWMATEKTRNNIAAAIHAICYTLPFMLVTQSFMALSAICASHFLVDRFRLARYIVWLKNGPFYLYEPEPATNLNGWRDPPRLGFRQRLTVKPVTATGYPDDVPAWLSVWLLIITDNTVHLLCNGVAIGMLA